MSGFFFRGCLAGVLAGAMLSDPAAAQGLVVVAQNFPAEKCLSRRDAIAAVRSGRAVPLRQVRPVAEEAARGEMINAEMCVRDGQPVYVLTVLSTSGKVVYVTLSAKSGKLVGVR